MGEQECDQIFRIPADGSGEPVLVSTGEGRTTCAYFTYPEGDRVLYATTHLADPACPPPDRSKGYVWALYDSFDIVSAALDGSDLRRLTDEPGYDAEATVCPVDGRVIFSSNLSSAGGREFDLWAVDTDGTDLERITWAEEFDGFPLFSPDGKRLAFASNRHHAREGETNLFVARWQGGGAPAEDLGLPEARTWELRGPDRFLADVAWLADDAREGRGIGTDGLLAVRDWLVERFTEIGLEPAGEDGGWLQRFEVPVAVALEEGTALAIDGARTSGRPGR